MTLDRFKAFAAVARHRNASRASKERHISQAARKYQEPFFALSPSSVPTEGRARRGSLDEIAQAGDDSG